MIRGRTKTGVLLAAVVALPLLAAGCSSGGSSSSTTATTGSATTGSTSPPTTTGSGTKAATGSPITIAYISSLTGEGASQDGSSPAGFTARIDLQNAEGGIDGHRLVPEVIDDQTSPSEIATAVQTAVANAFGIVSQSPLFFLAAKYPQAAGVPVTGSYDDGPEWGTQPYTNMFASDNGSVNPSYPVNTQIGDFLKSHGGTVLGSYGYSISPSSSRAAIGTAQSFQHAGGKVGVLDTTVPFGSVDFTSTALVAKQDGINSLVPALDNDSNYALATSLAQAGVKLKAVLFATGYQTDTIGSPVWSDLQGDYFMSLFRPFSLPDAGTEQMQAAMEKYAGFTSGDFPTFSQYEAWAGADLMIKGLLLDGPDPTRAGVIAKLRGVTSYDADGLLPQNLDYATNFGKNPPEECAWILQAARSGFNVTSPTPTCGTDLPHTDTASSS
ncbi:MAG: ABC transporter substrate-binding protein [Acidimicrobiales bacterium]|jgi:branched-chain amino acid transport system substrate-binding protein